MKFIGANGFNDFLSGYGLWVIIGCLGLSFVVALIFLFLNIIKAKKAKEIIAEKEKVNKEPSSQISLEEVIVETEKKKKEDKEIN